MRALVALVTCVILLAVIQGSYLVIDAHHNPTSVHITDDAHHEQHHGKETEHHGKHSSNQNHKHQSNHHDNHQQPIQKTDNNPSNRGILSKDGLTVDKVDPAKSGCQGYQCTNPHKATEVKLVPLEIHNNGTGAHRILYQTLNDKQQQQQQQPYKHTPDGGSPPGGGYQSHNPSSGGYGNHSHYPHGPHVQRSDVHNMNNNNNNDVKSYKPQGDRLLMEGMQGDMPLAENQIREHFLLDDPIRHQRDKNKSRGKRKDCLTHDDCEQGDCCLTRHKGPSMCVTSRKEAGARCVDSCTCQEGLECFVAKVNKFGRPRRRNGRHPLLGKCQDPNEPTSVPGYWATFRPGVETSTLGLTTTATDEPRAAVQTTSIGPARSRASFMG